MWATILFTPFFGVQVVDIGVTSIAGFQFFGVLFITRCIIDATWNGTGLVRISRANTIAALFLVISVASLFMAVIKAGTVEVYTEGAGTWAQKMHNPDPLKLSTFNFTQLLYPTFGIFIFHFIVKEIESRKDVKKVIDIMVMSAVVIAGMSLAAGVMYTIGQKEIYNKILGFFVAGPLSGVTSPEAGSLGQIFRMYTIAGEAGYTAIVLLVGVGLTMGDLLRKGKSIVQWPIVKLAVLSSAVLLNGSTTGYFGAVLLVIWGIIAPWYIGRRKITSIIRPFGYLLVGLMVVGTIMSFVQVSGINFYEWVATYHISKIQGYTGSGTVRLSVSLYTLKEVFLENPILGVGYGSHLSLSFATFLLSNVGIIGSGIFVAFIYVIFRNSNRVIRIDGGILGKMAFMNSFVLIPLMGTLFIGKSAVVMIFGITWIIIAIAEATYQVRRQELQAHHSSLKHI